MKVSKFRDPQTKRLLFRVYCVESHKPFDIINDFLRHLERRSFAANTVRSNAYDLTRFFKYLSVIKINWDAISVDNIVNYTYHLRHAKSETKISNIPVPNFSVRSESTINRMLSSVIGFYRYYYLQHGILLELGNKGVFSYGDSNGSSKGFLSFASYSKPNSLQRAQRLIRNQGLKNKIPKILDKDEQRMLVSLCKNKRDQLLILLLLETGLRIGQALQLKHQDIEPWHKKLIIEYREDNENEVYAKSLYSNSLILSDDWIELYTDYVACDLEKSDSEYIFIKLYRKNNGNINEPLSYESVKILFNRVSKKIGRKITPHMLRHTHATELLQAGVPIEMVAKRLGHRSVETTKKIYEHLTALDMKVVLEKARNKAYEHKEQ